MSKQTENTPNKTAPNPTRAASPDSGYAVYLLRCEGNAIYTGIAADLKKRIAQHFDQSPRCAKYTKSHRAVALAAAWHAPDRASASRLEYRLKRLPKDRKEALCEKTPLEKILPDFSPSDGFRPFSERELHLASPHPSEAPPEPTGG